MTGAHRPAEDIWSELRRTTQARIGLGRAGNSMPSRRVLEFQAAHAAARDAVHDPLDLDDLRKQLADLDIAPALAVESQAHSRSEYLRRPDLGRRPADVAHLPDTGADIAIMLYTSGTTGRPKGGMLSFDNLIITGRNGVIRENLTEDEAMLAYLPMAWIGDNIFSVAQAYITGFCVSCPESSEAVLEDLRDGGVAAVRSHGFR